MRRNQEGEVPDDHAAGGVMLVGDATFQRVRIDLRDGRDLLPDDPGQHPTGHISNHVNERPLFDLDLAQMNDNFVGQTASLAA